jgi:methyl-accepting chemotaxis protein
MTENSQITAAAAGDAALHEVRCKADRTMSLLLLAHVPVALGLATLHGTWLVAFVVGAIAAGIPLALATRHPGAMVTRVAMAVGFMAFSVLFIQQAHGAIELHFHIFGVLAFLLVYRDWRVIVVGAAVIAVHHVVFDAVQRAGGPLFLVPAGRGGLAMVSVHAAFVVVESAVLLYLAVAQERETRTIAAMRHQEAAEAERLHELAQALERRDLTASGHVQDSEGALGALSEGIDHVAELVRSIQSTAADVTAATRVISDASEESGRASTETANAIAEIAAGMEIQARIVTEAIDLSAELADAVGDSAEAADEAAGMAGDTRTVAEEGVATADDATEAMRAVRESSAAISAAISELSEHSGQIVGFVDTISGIAEQTNLLALNAAIEAARAGEQGRGFAVVAEEVRKLAEESRAAAGKIAELVADMDQVTDNAVTVVEDGAQRTVAGTETVERARVAFERISSAVGDVTSRVSAIAEEGRQLATRASDMRGRMEELGAIAERSSASTQQVSASTQQSSASAGELAESAVGLARAADALDGLVVQFTVERSAETPASVAR